MRRNQANSAFYFAIGVSAVLPFIPVLRLALLPFDYLNTHLHELFHGLAALVSGGTIGRILVFANSEGVTTTYGGVGPLISSAGYIGGSLFGALMIRSCTTGSVAQKWIRGLGIAILISNALWVRGDAIGWSVGFAWAVVLLLVAAKLPQNELLYVAQFLAVQQCVNGFKSLRDLILLSGDRANMTDAAILAKETGVPAMVWALLWTGLGTYGLFAAVTSFNRITSGRSKAN